jgi:hypothetical protein
VASWSNYTKHLRDKHHLHWAGSDIVCGQDGSPRKYASFNSLRFHMHKAHSDVFMAEGSISGATHTNSLDVDAGNEEVASENLSDDGHADVAEDDFDLASHFQHLLSDFVYRLQAQSTANVKLIDETVELVKNVVNEIIQPVCKQATALLERKNVDLDKVIGILQKLESLPNITDKFVTQHKRQMQLALDGLYVEPQEYVVGTRTDTKFSALLGFSEEKTVEDRMYYITEEGTTEEFRAISLSRRDDIKRLASETFSARSRWIESVKPPAAVIIDRYPKYLTIPELVCSLTMVKFGYHKTWLICLY